MKTYYMLWMVALTSLVASMLVSTAAYAEAVSPAAWKNLQARYLECVVTSSNSQIDQASPETTVARVAVSTCEMSLYTLGASYAAWLKQSGIMAPAAMEQEVIRFVNANRSNMLIGMSHNVAAIREARAVVREQTVMAKN